VRVVLCRRDGVGAERGLRPAGRAPWVGHVEERQLRAPDAPLRRGVLADAEQQVVGDRVQVGGVAEDLQLADDAGLGLLGQVQRVERVDLAERHDVALVAREAHGVDALALAQAVGAAEQCQL
jgi:hypothetical protein